MRHRGLIGRAWGSGACVFARTAVCILTPGSAHEVTHRRYSLGYYRLYSLAVHTCVGACDATSRIYRQSLGFGRICVCTYCCMYPDSRQRLPTTTINQLPPDKTTHPPVAAAGAQQQQNAREVAHPGYTFWVVECIGAYDAAPRMDSRQSWGRGRMYSMTMTSRPQATPTTTINNRHKKKKTAALLCCCSKQQCNSHDQSRGQRNARACCRHRLPAPPPPHRRLSCSRCAVGIWIDKLATISLAFRT